jgi:hypothetical protein
MPPPLDLEGRTFGRLLVLGRAGSDRHGKALWRCACACGKEVVTNTTQLRRGRTASCGCRRPESVRAAQRHPALRRCLKRLSEKVWPKTCPVCGTPFRGTARQVYCAPGCRLRYR